MSTTTGRNPVRVAVADIIRTHQRRHPAEPGCCCTWRPRRGGPGWSDHVVDQLEQAGLLATHPRPNTGDAPDA